MFVGNLPFDVQDEDLYRYFLRCGDIEFVRVVRDKKTNIGKGFGYVQFKVIYYFGDGIEHRTEILSIKLFC